MHFIDSIVFAFKEILNFKTMKFALISGILVTAFWILVAYMFWGNIISFTAVFLDLVPFSMIRSNGAWMLSSFLWFNLVLITSTLIFAFFGNIILNSVSKAKYSSFSIIIAILSALFWAVVWFFKGASIYAQFLQLMTWLPFETIEKGMSNLIGAYFVYSLIIVSIVFVVSAFSQPFLKSVNEKYYPYDKIIEDNEIKSIKYTIKDTAIFILASIILFPLFFIPVVNFIIQVSLWVWLMKDTYVYDSASLLIKDEDVDKLKEHKKAFFGLAIISSLFNFIPVFNVFGPVFGELSMFYYLKNINLK